MIHENFTIDFFLGNNHPGHIELLIYLDGSTPVSIQLVFTATVIKEPKPYGLGFSLNVPLIKVLPEASDASAISAFFTLARKTSRTSRRSTASASSSMSGASSPPKPVRSGVGRAPRKSASRTAPTVKSTTKIPCPRRRRSRYSRARDATWVRWQTTGRAQRVDRPRHRRRAGDVSRVRGAVALLATLAACCALRRDGGGGGADEANASMRPSLLPNRLGASTALTLAFRFSGGAEGVPAPLRGMVVHLPAGLTDQPARRRRSARIASLQRRGASGCPVRVARRARPRADEGARGLAGGPRGSHRLDLSRPQPGVPPDVGDPQPGRNPAVTRARSSPACSTPRRRSVRLEADGVGAPDPDAGATSRTPRSSPSR